MPFCRIEAAKIRVDKNGTLKTIDKAAKELFLESNMIFLKEVVKRVPVWSGMSRGSLRPLAKYLTDRGYHVSIPITPRASSKKARDAGQNIQAGEARGEFSVTIKDGKYVLIFHPKVRHYQTNEFTNVTRQLSDIAVPRTSKFGFSKNKSKRKNMRFLNLKHPTPWQSFTYGALKVKIFTSTVVAKKMPNFQFKTTKVSVGRTKGI